MQELSTGQRILLRVVVVVVILVILAMFGLIERHPAVVYGPEIVVTHDLPPRPDYS